jgi:ABC-type multidrug transport system ATPase subunit
MDADDAVELAGVRHRFKGTVADDMSLRVVRGSIVGIIGPSGAGKTTAVRLMTGGLAPSTGRIRVLLG